MTISRANNKFGGLMFSSGLGGQVQQFQHIIDYFVSISESSGDLRSRVDIYNIGPYIPCPCHRPSWLRRFRVFAKGLECLHHYSSVLSYSKDRRRIPRREPANPSDWTLDGLCIGGYIDNEGRTHGRHLCWIYCD